MPPLALRSSRWSIPTQVVLAVPGSLHALEHHGSLACPTSTLSPYVIPNPHTRTLHVPGASEEVTFIHT